MTTKLIAHSLIKVKDKYLVIKRSEIKRGKRNVYPAYWDIPGGSVEIGELPRDAALRECMEEVGLVITLNQIIHEDSNLDKGIVFTRLVYSASVVQPELLTIKLDPEEHVQYRWIKDLSELLGEKVVPYLIDILSATAQSDKQQYSV